MKGIQERIDNYEGEIQAARRRETSIRERIGIFDKKIEKLKLQIESLDMVIAETSADIRDYESRLQEIEQSISKEKGLLGEYIQSTWRNEDLSTVRIIFGNNDLSEFFDRLKSIQDFRKAILTTLEDIREEKENLTQKRAELREKQQELYDMKGLQEIQKRTLAKQKENQQVLLAEAENTKRVFLSLVEESEQDLEAIKKELYQLEGLGVSMQFKQALDKARFASEKTGVRPALLLAVLKRESQWGTDLGSGTWRQDMKPSQHEAFLEICGKLGLNPDSVPVSKKPHYGWGGAMGPAQFLPATWLGYEADVARLTGHNPPNPWDMDDALVALAVKLEKDGAVSQRYQDEWQAVMSFFAGTNWDNPNFRFYGDSVMDLAAEYQTKINILEANK